ncbi:UDP-N-acetylglucosamine 1-carboxyvinyltransferase [Candidatus Gracilibacteria bacterium]|nr:UDP-N-acetylglucosamine 1-carboxyvinyltransferase [Candidatus Gracilibacteria bacterium]
MFRVQGSSELRGSVAIGGSKNAALPIIAAALLVEGKTHLTNIPHIGDVHTFLDILSDIGVTYEFHQNNLTLDTSSLEVNGFDFEKVKKIRVSILLFAPLLHRIGKIHIPHPGGCQLGKRPIDAHLEGLKNIGYVYTNTPDSIIIDGSAKPGDKEIHAGFGVTSTENLIVANVLRPGTTTLRLCALEPHVINLIDFLKSLGANIELKHDHTIVIQGVSELKSKKQDFRVVSDYIQSGTYMILGALSAKEYIDIEHACYDDLYSFVCKLREAGVKIEKMQGDSVRVYRATDLKSVSIQTNIFPGFPTDLQSPFSVLMTQAKGISKIHEVLFESRLNFLVELEKMGAQVALMNPHQALIFGPSELKATTVTSWDLRAGVAMILAACIAKGETTITNNEYIYRGYENIVENLQSLGVDICEEVAP